MKCHDSLPSPLAGCLASLLAEDESSDHRPTTLLWRGTPLTRDIHHGALSRFENLAGTVLASVCGSNDRGRLLVVDSDGSAAGLRSTPRTDTLDIMLLEASMPEVARWGRRRTLDGFDGVLVVFETTTVRVEGRPRPQEVCALPPTSRVPWMFVGVGEAGYADPWLRELRYWGRRLGGPCSDASVGSLAANPVAKGGHT